MSGKPSKLGCRKCDAGIEHRACELYDKTVTPPEGEAATEQVTPKYTNRHGEPCSEACGQGRHAECTETFQTCNCTFRGLHKTMHRYATIPAPVVSTAAPEPAVAPESYKPAEGPKQKKPTLEELKKLFPDGRMCLSCGLGNMPNLWKNTGCFCGARKWKTIWTETPAATVTVEKPGCTCPTAQWTGSEPNDSMCELTEEEHAQLDRAAATPVTVEAPKVEVFEDLLKNSTCSCGGWKCERCQVSLEEIRELLATPKPIGDVRQIAINILANCAMKYCHPENWSTTDPQSVIDQQVENAAAILSPFFAPAGPENKEQK